ncbi:MAG TPA: beta-ketoacyl-[acyl-carrier-protein] synthase family protein [Chthoniobacterales bacterium]
MPKRNRVVVTGMGVLAPNGTGLNAFWSSLMEGRSGIGPITHFDASRYRSRIAGEVKGFDPHDYIEPELKPKRMARHTQLAYAAAMMALRDARLDLADLELPSPTPVIIGVSMNAMDVVERAFHAVQNISPNRAAPTTSGASIPQAPANVIADRLGLCADAGTISSACPSGLDALADAAAMIRSGEAEIAIAGGTDAPITPLVMASFIASGLSSERNDEPEKASRPFDIHRDSGVISEGAGIMILENLERAEARGAPVYLEIASYGKQRDRDHERPASGLQESMRMALGNAGWTLEDVDYISAYGPGHPILDAAEIQVTRKFFGPRADHIPINSIKGSTGNALAAGGPFQVIASALTVRHQTITPTTNCDVLDPACDMDIVRFKPRKTKIQRLLINVRGLGGSANTMAVNRVNGG